MINVNLKPKPIYIHCCVEIVDILVGWDIFAGIQELAGVIFF